MVITSNDILNNYEFPQPVGPYILCEFSEKESEVKVGKIIMETSAVQGYKTYLIVKAVSKILDDTFKEGDLIEVVDTKVTAFSYGENFSKKFGLVHADSVACLYKKK